MSTPKRDISPEKAKARENHRQKNGEFGTQPLEKSGVAVPAPATGTAPACASCGSTVDIDQYGRAHHLDIDGGIDTNLDSDHEPDIDRDADTAGQSCQMCGSELTPAQAADDFCPICDNPVFDPECDPDAIREFEQMIGRPPTPEWISDARTVDDGYAKAASVIRDTPDRFSDNPDDLYLGPAPDLGHNLSPAGGFIPSGPVAPPF